jgi:hypothetical protein
MMLRVQVAVVVVRTVEQVVLQQQVQRAQMKDIHRVDVLVQVQMEPALQLAVVAPQGQQVPLEALVLRAVSAFHLRAQTLRIPRSLQRVQQ